MNNFVYDKLRIALYGAALWLTLVSCASSDASPARTEISPTLTIGNEWVEIRPAQTMKVKSTRNGVYLRLETPSKSNWSPQNFTEKNIGILMPDGQVINPEVQVIDRDGNVFTLAPTGALIGGTGLPDSLFYTNASSAVGALPADREYTLVRIRSPRQIKLNSITWQAYDLNVDGPK